ncbi:tRNA(Met) cytidine acetyltransferase TmcA [Rosenbergiella epipactidis]|uniref:tRNA(Met) cytidine acetyltransferase TmcA n=1 Tax=Rosenbergiella epipactidis TaxID=1544694 RepID=UPI001F4FC52C|nr:GNAT family N-acetyltransferase [Rosenbergiella epipactidis]
MQSAFIAEQMRRKGLRRICVISGSQPFRDRATLQWQVAYPGDWLRVATAATGHTDEYLVQRAQQFLGQEWLHAIYDASQGLHLETLAALAGTLVAGSWLVLLLPESSAQQPLIDVDSLRWAECQQPIATPIFYRHLWRQLLSDTSHLIWREGEPAPTDSPLMMPDWTPQGGQAQQAIIEALRQSPAGNYSVTAPRGRGKSALGGMLAALEPPCLITGPAKVATAVMARHAGEHYHFQAPDAILTAEDTGTWQWLIIDEAASLPTPQLHALIARFPRCLLLTTTEGYEGTGQGFLLKFAASGAVTKHYTLTTPQRYSAHDPLESFIERLLVLRDRPASVVKPSCELSLRVYQPEDWQQHPVLATTTFQLLQSAHYRTTPIDLRRMMDAPQCGYWQMVDDQCCYGALGWVEEGEQSAELAQAVWRGERRPRGNLVAQSLAAHSRFPQAMLLASRRISRIAVSQLLRRQGIGQRLVAALRQSSQDKDFLSVSFGYTPALWQFWQRCGFQLVRMGTQREASSGCYAAMAVAPLTEAGQQLCEQAVAHFQRDWPIQQARYSPELSLNEQSRGDILFSADDYQELVGFAQAHRPLSVSFPALWRAWQCYPHLVCGQYLQHCLHSPQLPAGWSRKQWLVQLRRETAEFLTLLPDTSC